MQGKTQSGWNFSKIIVEPTEGSGWRGQERMLVREEAGTEPAFGLILTSLYNQISCPMRAEHVCSQPTPGVPWEAALVNIWPPEMPSRLC